MRKALTAFGAGLLIGLGAIALIVALMKGRGSTTS